MHLEPGYYTIHNGVNLVGRSLVEDLSFNPKTVFNATTDPESIWQVESLPDGKYLLRNFEAPVAPIDGHVKAIIYPNINENDKIFEWQVTLREYQGKNLYTIATSAGDGFWHTTSDTTSPIAVGPVIVNPSNPPQFTKNALFRFEPVALKSGIYTIHNESSPVGRASFEDLSLNPKPVYNATDTARSLWYINAENNGKYKLFNLGAPVAAEGDRLFAFIQPDLDQTDPRFDWTVEPQFHQGRFLYTITKPNHDGWFTTSNKFSQIKIGPLPSTKSLPPQYFPNALFRIAPFVLRSGFYKIRNNNDLVGRAFVETQSLDPKPILNKTDNPDTTWFIQNVGPNGYKLSASQGFDVISLDSASEKFRGYNPVGVEKQGGHSLVFAFLEPKFVGPNWAIIPRPEYGEDVYTIQLHSSPSILLDRSWFAHEGEKSQIEIKNVLFQHPIPPNLLFKIDSLAVPLKEKL